MSNKCCCVLNCLSLQPAVRRATCKGGMRGISFPSAAWWEHQQPIKNRPIFKVERAILTIPMTRMYFQTLFSGATAKQQRSNSEAHSSQMACGSTTFPRLLLIFRPSVAATKPCAKTVLGISIPALLSMHGQITQWNQVMSLPITCTEAGQNADSGSSENFDTSGSEETDGGWFRVM